MNRFTLLVLHLLSLVLLGFGWFTNMLHIEVNAHFIFDLNLFNEDRSVIGTLQTLWKTGNFWPFLLIFFFGIVIPLVKSAAVFYLLWSKNPRPGWYGFVNAISKWAMADVFAVGIFVAFLGANAMQNTSATLEPGFYYFSAYVILGAIISMLLGKLLKNAVSSNI